MYAVIGEDKSDVQTLRNLINNIETTYKRSLTTNIKTKGYTGGGEFFSKAASQIRVYNKLGCAKFIVCHDSDTHDPAEIKDKLIKKIIKPSTIQAKFCALVPKQEIEAWLLADINSITKLISSWHPGMDISHPENIVSPKEHLEKLSRTAKKKPRYYHADHNPYMASVVDIALIEKKCPSFKPLVNLVIHGEGNVD